MGGCNDNVMRCGGTGTGYSGDYFGEVPDINATFAMKVDMEIFDDKIRPYIDSLRQSFLMNEGKYSFVIRTVDNSIIYVIPNKLGKPNEATKLRVVLESENETIKNKLEKLTQN